MGFNSIHETVIEDILGTIRDGVKFVDGKMKPKSPKIRTASSLSRATAGLTLTFPVIVEDSLDLETSVMISKAIERKNIALLQMAFSAYNITNATDAISHLSKFHTNINADKLTVDKFMDVMDNIHESADLYESAIIPESTIRAIVEDNKRNCNFVLDDSINESSLSEFSEVSRYGQKVIIKEAIPGPKMYDGLHPNGRDYTDDELADLAKNGSKEDKAYALSVLKSRDQDRRDDASQAKQDERSAQQDKLQRDKMNIDITRNNNDARKAMGTASDQKRQYLASQLLPGEVKKANEMQPSLMIVNFYVNDKDRDLNVAQQIVAGVKSKMYPVSSADVSNKIITKAADADIMLKLVKVSTREISFVKDFLLGLDDAKLDSLSKSRKGSNTALFKALERRALKGKIRKTLKLENSAKAISSLVLSVETVEELKKYNNIDLMNPKIAAKIMEKLNLLYLVIADTTSESVNILTDGEYNYETLSFTALERETGDGAYKKVVKLMTNMSM